MEHETVTQAVSTGDDCIQKDEDMRSVESSNNEKLTERQHLMLERLSKVPEVIVRSQQKDEPDLSAEQKLDLLKQIFVEHPDQFLARFGKHLELKDADCFSTHRLEGKYDVLYQLSEVEKLWSEGSRTEAKRLKNRRYEALKRLVETTDYFSEEEMQRRDPILYDQLIGRYQTEEERAAFLQQSWKSTSGAGITKMPLTDLFLAHLERTDEGVSCRRLQQECQQEEEDAAEAEYDSEDLEDYDMECNKPGTSKNTQKSPRGKPTVNDEQQPREEIEDEEKDLLKEEFFTTMYRNFLNGKDEDFDYSAVDDNPEYDCGENLENDEEEKYFDAEEARNASDPNSDSDDLFRPPVRSKDIESKIENLSMGLDIHENSNPERMEEQSTVVPVVDTDSEEDELDQYMKEIEKQLQQQS